MLKVYLKQAWQLLMQNKLYSSVYIIGTGLAIAATMTIAIIYYIKIAPVYPEVNRDRMLVAKGARIEFPKEEGMWASAFSYQFIQEHIYTLKTSEVASAVLNTWDDYPLVELPGEKGMLPVSVKYTDSNFWKVFGFQFVSGKPFNEAEFQSGIKTAVISASLANTLFGTTDAEGKRMKLDADDYRICGVVKDVSYATPSTYAQIWIPFTANPENIKPNTWGKEILGSFRFYILAPAVADVDKVTNEVDVIIHKMNSSHEEYVISLGGQPEAYWKSTFRTNNQKETDWGEVFKTLGILLLALLMIPAVNLAGMVSSRMEKRLPEMGLRKVFGASRGKLLNQVLVENFLLTLAGGLLGLLFSYLIMYSSNDWIMTLFDTWTIIPAEGTKTFFTVGMLFNPVVFCITFGVCLVLNFLSAIIPGYYGLKKGIVYSLSNNK